MTEDQKIDAIYKAFAPEWGYLDLKSALATAESAGFGNEWIVEQIEEYMHSTGTNREDIDVCAVVYDALYQDARADIENHTGEDICNDEPYTSIQIFSNYLDTQIDGKTEDMQKLADLIKTIAPAARSASAQWLLEEVEGKI